MKKCNVKLAATLFTAFSSFLICSCGSKIQTPKKIELVRPEKPTDAKYFEKKLNNDNTVSIIGIKMLDMINDDVYENILVPATIEGIPVSTVSMDIKCPKYYQTETEITNKKVQKKAYGGSYYLPQRLEFEEGIKNIGLATEGAYILTEGGDYSNVRPFDPVSDIDSGSTFSKAFNEESNFKLKQTFGLREIVFPDSVQRITGNITGIALEKVKFPANLKSLDCNITGLYYNNPEVVYPTSKFVVNGKIFTCFKADEFVIPDAISDITVRSSIVLDDYDRTKIKKLVLPKNLNVAYSFKEDGLLNEKMYYFKAEEIVVPDNATLTARSKTQDYRKTDFWMWLMSSSLKKFTLGKNATMDIFNFRPAEELEEFNIGEGAKINFDYAKKAGNGPNYFKNCTKLPISSQQKLKELGYEGEF